MPQDLQAIFPHFIDKRQKATGGLLLTAAEGRAVQAIPALAGRPAPVSRARPKLRELLAVCLRDCPSLHAGLAIRRRDTTTRPSHRSSGRERKGHPSQCTGRPMPLADPKSHKIGSAPNASEPSALPIGRMVGVRVPVASPTTGRRVPARPIAIPHLHKAGRRTRTAWPRIPSRLTSVRHDRAAQSEHSGQG